MSASSKDPTMASTAPRTPLLRPDRFFAEREFDALRLLAVVSLLVLTAPATVYGAGWVLTAHIDGTVVVDNPARPPDWFCGDGTDTEMDDERGCEQPREVERDVDEMIRPAIGRLLGPALGASLFVWLLVGLLLHSGSWLAGGSGGTAPSFAVAAWGLVPGVVGPVVGLVALYLWMDPVTVTPGMDPAEALEPVTRQLRSIRPFLTAVTVVTTVWSAVIWRFGLEHKRGLSSAAAWSVAGVVAVLIVMLALV